MNLSHFIFLFSHNNRKAIFNDPEDVVVVDQPPLIDQGQPQQQQQEAN